MVDLYRLFWEAGLAVGFSFIFGFALGLFVATYLRRKLWDKG